MHPALFRGIDIVSIARIEKALERSGDRFLHRIFDGRELELRCDTGFLATRFAAKEAFFKALGTGVSDGVCWHDFVLPPAEQLSLDPVISGRSSKLLADRKVLVSVSRTHTTAVAVVFLQAAGE
ncbi:holo-[acyl-carrier-protein] synthase [Candidatus Fermentibacteria bacterium]|nr:MAG: holo-[acyl-carrier-protein] synthase [Candidatus Fermentibacteria bacterium]